MHLRLQWPTSTPTNTIYHLQREKKGWEIIGFIDMHDLEGALFIHANYLHKVCSLRIVQYTTPIVDLLLHAVETKGGKQLEESKMKRGKEGLLVKWGGALLCFAGGGGQGSQQLQLELGKPHQESCRVYSAIAKMGRGV